MIGLPPTGGAALTATCCALAIAASLQACAQRPIQEPAGLAVEAGRRVTIAYTIRGSDETVLTATAEDGPFSYVHGQGDLRPSLEGALTGLRRGATARVRIEASEAFGLYNEAKVLTLPRMRFPADVAVGAEYEDQIGRTLRVIDIDQGSVTVDWNHPMAGQDLIVDVVILDVQAPAPR